MKIVRTVEELTALRNDKSFSGKRLGFVPTMGALHEGSSFFCQDGDLIKIFNKLRRFNCVRKRNE